LGFLEQLQPAVSAEPVVEEINVVLMAVDEFQRFVVAGGPFDFVPLLFNFGKILLRENEIILVIVHQQHFDGGGVHQSGGNSTISNQYFPRTFMVSTNDWNVTGFVTYEF